MPTKVLDALASMGFSSTHGAYDFVYSWDKKATIDDVISLGDKVQQTLKGMHVMFKMETI